MPCDGHDSFFCSLFSPPGIAPLLEAGSRSRVVRSHPAPPPVSHLEAAASQLIFDSYSPTTLLNYHRAWCQFLKFLSDSKLPGAFPFSAASVELYVAFLNLRSASIGSIKGALSAIGWYHRAANLPDPTKSFGVKRMLVSLGRSAPAVRKADPISFGVLEACLDRLGELGLSCYDSKLLKAILLILYYGCLRVGEVTLSTNPDNVLRLANTEFLTINGCRHFRFTLLKFKNSRGPIALTIQPNPSARHCPVEAIGDFLRSRPRGGLCCFVKSNGEPVPRAFVADHLALLLTRAGFVEGHFGTHSLRAGRATDLALAGVPDAVIRATGRWASDAFKGYLRFPSLPQPGALGVVGAGAGAP